MRSPSPAFRLRYDRAMPFSIRSSRRRYRDYLVKAKKPRDPSESNHHGDGTAKKKGPRTRSFFILFQSFWQMLRGQRGRLALLLTALTLSTILGLTPLYGTKIVFDGVLRDPPLASTLPPWVPLPHDRRSLLTFVTIG